MLEVRSPTGFLTRWALWQGMGLILLALGPPALALRRAVWDLDAGLLPAVLGLAGTHLVLTAILAWIVRWRGLPGPGQALLIAIAALTPYLLVLLVAVPTYSRGSLLVGTLLFLFLNVRPFLAERPRAGSLLGLGAATVGSLALALALSEAHRPAPGAALVGPQLQDRDPPPIIRDERAADRKVTMWAPYLEWGVQNSSYSGNPFDTEAWVTFTHAETGQTHRTQMFHDGDDTWKFRFTGTRPGWWTFYTESADADLDGRTGTVMVGPNPCSDHAGFLVAHGNRFAVQTGPDELNAIPFHIYMNLIDFPVQPDRPQTDTSPSRTYSSPETSGLSILADPARLHAYLDDARYHGFDVIFVQLNNNVFRFGAEAWRNHNSSDPDPQTFRVLENIVTTAHGQGMRVHFWAWGDEERRWTPLGVPGGFKGEAHRRAMRYLAARLGPLPGWSMGLGFDLHEWTTESDREWWARYLHDHMGWPHLLTTRGYGPGSVNVVSYSSMDRRPREDFSTSRHGPRGYEEMPGHIDQDLTRPHLYEERHTHGRWEGWPDMDQTRRLLWWTTMVGGIGGWWGYFWPRMSPEKYPNPEQLRTHREFWKDRFLMDMERDPAVAGHLGTLVLRSGTRHLVAYREGVGSVRLDLSSMGGVATAVAVDTRTAYEELDLGTLDPDLQTIELPYHSDWAVAVGDFSNPRSDAESHRGSSDADACQDR
jgi:hypothetical protein